VSTLRALLAFGGFSIVRLQMLNLLLKFAAALAHT